MVTAGHHCRAAASVWAGHAAAAREVRQLAATCMQHCTAENKTRKKKKQKAFVEKNTKSGVRKEAA